MRSAKFNFYMLAVCTLTVALWVVLPIPAIAQVEVNEIQWLDSEGLGGVGCGYQSRYIGSLASSQSQKVPKKRGFFVG